MRAATRDESRESRVETVPARMDGAVPAPPAGARRAGRDGRQSGQSGRQASQVSPETVSKRLSSRSLSLFLPGARPLLRSPSAPPTQWIVERDREIEGVR